MASDNEASCVSDPNFAVICSFLECFGKSCGINYPDIARLQEMIEDAHEVPQPLVELHIKLLRKARKSVSPEKWERSLVKFCHTYSNQDGWELERFGYKKARIAVKLRLLKVLLEAQFDLNPKFKNEVNKLAAEQLRVEPLGRDKTGLAYWFQLDEECNIRVYREDLDEENWELVARDREGVVSLINTLSDGEAGPIPINEDSNSLEISEKPIIDTGQIEEDSPPEEPNNISSETKTDHVNSIVINNKHPKKAVEDSESLENNVNDEEEEDEDEEDEEDEEEDGDEEEVSNEESSKQNSEDDDEEDEEEGEEDEDEDEEDSQDASENQEDKNQIVTSTKIIESLIPPIVQAKQQIFMKQPRGVLKPAIPEVTCTPITVNLNDQMIKSQMIKSAIPRPTNAEPTPPKAIETPVIRTLPLKLVNIQDLQHPVEDRITQREEKYSSKQSLAFQPSDSGITLTKFSPKPIDKLAANLSRIQSEKLEKPGAAKLLEKIAENLARSSGAHSSLANGDEEKIQQEFSRNLAEKPNSSVPTRSQRGMDLSTSPRGWENSNDHGRPMDYSGIDLSSRKSTKQSDLHQSGYRSQEFQHREMDLSTRKISKPEVNPLAYDPRTVILRNHTMVTDLSKKQMYSGYEIPPAAYHNAASRIPGKEDHRLPNYTILSDPSKIASMRMPLKRPLEIIENPQQEMLKRMRGDITLRGTMDKRATSTVGQLRREEVGPAIEEPVMMVHGEGSGSDCDAVNPILGEAIEEKMLFFYGEGSGRECETGNPGDESSSDNKESNESKNEGCSDVSTSLTPTKSVNDATSVTDVSSISSSLRINDNYSQASTNASGTTDNCHSTSASSVSPKSKFKPTLGVQVIAKSSASPGKKCSRWDVRTPDGKSEECDSSIISSEGHISLVDESINAEEYQNRSIAADDGVVVGKAENDDITSTSNQTFTSKIAECSSSVEDSEERKEIPVAMPDSSVAAFKETPCDSSEAAISSAEASQSVESTVKEGCSGEDVCFGEKLENTPGESSGSPPRFFFGPNCVSYTSKNDQAGNQAATTSVTTCESGLIECTGVAKNNNNFVKIADTCDSESSEGSCESNIEARLEKIELKEENKPDSASADKGDEAEQSDCRVQSSTSSDVKHQTVTSEQMEIQGSLDDKDENISESHEASVDTTDRIESVESTSISQSHSIEKFDPQKARITAESSVPQDSLPIEVPREKEESKTICEAKTSSDTVSDEIVMEVEEEQKDNAEEQPQTMPEATELMEDEKKEETHQTNDDFLPLSMSNEAPSSSLQENPDDSYQTFDTIDEKLDDSKHFELSSDIDEKTKQSTESEDDSSSVVKNNEEKTNELCNEDAQDGFSKSSETVEDVKEVSESISNISKAQRAERESLDEKSITSVELPEDSSGDSEAVSSASLLVNPSGGEDSISEIGETSSPLGCSDPSPIEEDPPLEEVSPAVIVDSNIIKSPERITIASQKASSSSRLLDTLDTYTDELSENPSSGDQDSNEAMVIDDRTSDSNESTNFKDKVATIEASKELKASKPEDEPCEVASVAEEAVEKLDVIEESSIKQEAERAMEGKVKDSKTVEDKKKDSLPDESEGKKKSENVPSSSIEESASAIDKVKPKSITSVELDEKPVTNIEEKAAINVELEEKSLPSVHEESETSLETEEKTAGRLSLVPNYDCSDDDDVSDDVFESELIETDVHQETVTNEKLILENIREDKTAKDQLYQVLESKSTELLQAKTSLESTVSQLKNKLIEKESKSTLCENNKDFSEAGFENEENEDSGEMEINLDASANKIVDKPDSIEVEEKIVTSNERIDPEISLERTEKSTESSSKIADKSSEKIPEDVVSIAKVSQTHKEVLKEAVNDSTISSEVPGTIGIESKEIAQEVCEKTTWKEPVTEKSSQNDIVTETSSKYKNIESLLCEKVSSDIDDDKNIVKQEDSKPIIEDEESEVSKTSKLEPKLDDSLREVKSHLPSKIHETESLLVKDHDISESSSVPVEKLEEPSEGSEQQETNVLPEKEYTIPESLKIPALPNKIQDQKESELLPIVEDSTPKSSGASTEISKLLIEERNEQVTNAHRLKERNISKIRESSVASETAVHSIAPEIPEKISSNNAVPELKETSGPSKESLSISTSKALESNESILKINYLSEKPKEIQLGSPVEINQSSLKNEFKKEASKRLHGVSDGDDFPPTKSKPPNVDSAKEISDYSHQKDDKVDAKKIVISPEAPAQVAFASVVTSGDTTVSKTLPQPRNDAFDKLKNHEADEPRENSVKPSIEAEAVDKKSSEIQSVDVKCIDLESDDSMGIDNESMFDTAADDVDPLACTEEDSNKPTELQIPVQKIGIRLKPVEDLVYEGWKLDSPEPAAPPTVSRKRRNSANESNSDAGTVKLDDDEAGGKRMKLRGKRSPDMKLRKSVEQSRPESMSSEDEASKTQSTDDVVELKESGESFTASEKASNDRKPRGRPRGKRRRGNRSMANRVTRATKSTDNTVIAEVSESIEAARNAETAASSQNIVASVPTAANAGPVESKKKRKKRKMVLGLEVGIDIAVPGSQTGQDEVPVRQSRRIAQLKIKEEADKRRIEEETLGDTKENKKERDGTEKKKRKKQKPESEEEPIVVMKEVEREVKSKKHRKKKKFSPKEFNEAKPWQSSSGSSTSDEEAQEDEDEEDVESEGSLLFKSDHEFSPESDLEKDDESEPLRRARTAQKSTSDVEEADDEYACQKCGKADHPEWILLCDTCDKGWHCSCLRPALMLIPEGDWFCPPCQHNVLVTKLRESLKTFDQNSKKHENEVLRKKRLAFVGISLDNVIHKTEAGRDDHSSSRGSDESSSSSSESSSSSSSSDESEPVYQLRERRCANTYKFNEYDDMINAAIQDEVEAVQGAGNQGRGKDIATIVNAEKEEAQAEALKARQLDEDEDDDTKKSDKESDEDYKFEKDEDEDEEDTARKMIVKKTLSRKKHRKLNSLDISSEDDPESDEDFKGSSSDEEEDFDDQMYSTDDSFAQSRRRGRKGEARPVRRSTRAARKTRYDEDFINDDSDDSDRPKRKKSRSVWEGSESEESDNSWRQRKKKSRTAPAPRLRASSKTKSRKKKKRRRIIEPDNQSDNEEAIEAQHADVDEKEETETTGVQPQEAEPSNENVVATSENIVTNVENHEEEQVENKDTTVETPNADEELPKKKKKELTPKPKKGPGIRRKIVYGGLDDGSSRQEEETLSRRTRGRKINYQDIMGSDSEEELKKVLRKTEESEDEFVVNEGEEFNEDAEKDSDSGDIYSPNKEISKGKSPKAKKPKNSKSPGGRKSLTDNGTPKERKKPGPKPGSKNRPRQSSLSIAPDLRPKDSDTITRGLDIEGTTMSATGSVIGEVPEGSLTGLTPEDINALDDDQIEQMMMEDEEYGRRQLELAAIEIARNKKAEEREAKKLEKARLKALEILAAEQARDPNVPEGTDGETPKKKKRGRRSKAEILAEQMRRDGVPSLLTGSMIPAVVHQEVTANVLSSNITTNPTLPTVISSIETSRSPESHIPLMAGPDGQLFNPDGSPMKPKRRGRGKGKKTLALEAARAAEAAAKAAAETGAIGIITGTDSNPEVKHDDIPNVLPTPGSSTSGSAPPTPPASSVVSSQGHQPAQSPSTQQTVYPSLPPTQQSSVITRMLQSQPVSSSPQSFTAAAAAMGHKYFGGPNAAGQMMVGPRPSNYDMPARGRIPSPYRQPGPSPMPPHFAAIRSGAPPMRMRGPGPQLYHTPHHPMDPSPSGGGPISINSRDRSSPLGPGTAMIPPAAGSPLAKGGPTPPPPPYVRGGPPALSRFAENPQMPTRHQVPPFTTPSPTNHSLQQPSPPPNRPSGNFSPYHPPPPPNYHYGAYPPPPPMTTADDAAAYQGSPYSAEHFSTPSETQPAPIQQPPQPPPQPGPPQPHANETSAAPGNKQYDEEGTGEFGGLVSYFSSQREDDLDS